MCSKTGIVLFVYNRPYHTKEVLEGLKKNNISKLYIFSDGSKNDKDKAEVKEVRNLIRNVEWCETEIHINSTNKGLANSIVDGVNYMLSKYDRVIVLEDDCVPSPDFVSFMGECFNRYENTEKIMSISGYSLPIKIPKNYKHDIYFAYRSCSSGWGTWKRAWKYFNRDEDFMRKIEESMSFRKRVLRAGEDLISMLERQRKGIIDSWAVFWSLNIIKKEGLCIFPVKPRIQNIGFDGSGVHCKTRTTSDVELLNNYTQSLNFPEDIEPKGEIIREIKGLYSLSFSEKFRAKVKNLLKTIRLYNFLRSIKYKIIGEKDEKPPH
jgi:hypothetical protein